MDEHTPRWSLSRRSAEVAFASCTGAVGLVIVTGAGELDTGWSRSGPEAGYFPFRIGILLVVASALVLARSIFDRSTSDTPPILTENTARRLAWFAWPLIGLVAAVPWLGLYLAVLLYILVAIGFVGRTSWPTTAAIALVFPICLYALFEYVFKVPLPKGPILAMFGVQ